MVGRRERGQRTETERAGPRAALGDDGTDLGAVALGWWSTAEVMLLFWAENVVIGAVHLLRFAILALVERHAAPLGVALFFALHYGLFTFVHGVFVVTLFGGALAEEAEAGLAAVLFSPEGLLFGVGALLASHLFSFLVNFLHGGEYRAARAEALMMQPYARIIVLHLAILFGGSASLALGEPAAALVLLVVLKIGFDLRAHLAEHRRPALRGAG
ncbi:MAG: DUF6498-containing protein, partial [Elioraea tepidiphila]